MRREIRTIVEADDTDRGLAQVVRTVLLVARLGEADRRGWWATHSFGAAGRVVLKGRLPRTWRMAAVELDIAAARNRHDEIIERANAVHLFSDNWPVRRWASAWVAEQKTEYPADEFFKELEIISTEEISARLTGQNLDAKIAGDAARVGSVDRASFETARNLESSVALLAAAYAQIDEFTVPYLEIIG